MDGLTLALIAVVVALILAGAYLLVTRGKVGDVDTAPAPSPRGLAAALHRVWGGGMDDTAWDRIEESLLAADIGVEPASRIVSGVRSDRPVDLQSAQNGLRARLEAEFSAGDRSLRIEGHPAVILVVGVNGSGKTTTIAKLAARLRSEGRSVLLGAADTFRAAAGDQLGVWGDRLGVPVVRGEEGGDPASVAFDAISAARARGIDVVIIDTAGRLHSHRNLMSELAKVHRVAAGAAEVDEVLLVLDATTGQNGLAQAAEFASTLPVTGIVLAKLDGTAKGGIVVTVESRLGIPIKLVGVGEDPEDLEVFDPTRFVAELVGVS